MMENYLKELNAVLGVIGSFVCLPDGSVLAKEMPAQFEPQGVETAARAAIQTFNALDGSGQRIVEADLVFGQGRLVMKNLRGGILAIVCTRTINTPLLNLTANVVAKKIAAELKPKTAISQKPATEHARTTAGASATSRAPIAQAHDAPVAATPAEHPALQTSGTAAPTAEIAPSPLYVELEQETYKLLAAAKAARTTLCAMDPVATWVCCSKTRQLVSQPQTRHIDFCALLEQAPLVTRLFEQFGYELNQRFNSIHGNERLHLDHLPRNLSTDIYLDTFAMYHRFDLKPLLAAGAELASETYLVLIRLQRVEITEATLRELSALFLEHQLTFAQEKESINATLISRLCADDWGWYKTVKTNLDRLIEFGNTQLAPAERETLTTRAGQLRSGIEGAPKSLRWLARAGIGESVRWYETPVTVSQSARPDLSMR